MDKSPLPCAESRHSQGSRDAGGSPSPCEEESRKERHSAGLEGSRKNERGRMLLDTVDSSICCMLLPLTLCGISESGSSVPLTFTRAESMVEQ